jgi:hypothetical protein
MGMVLEGFLIVLVKTYDLLMQSPMDKSQQPLLANLVDGDEFTRFVAKVSAGFANL